VQGRARGVGGETPLVVGRVSALQLGQFTITNPITLFPAGEIVAPGKAGNIGGNILRRFRVIFDYLRHRLILEPNEHFSEVEEYDMSGASLSLLGLADQAIKVTRIIENSPAAEVGLKPEDILLTIDGRPTAEIGLSRIREMFKQEGREYQLNIKRGAEMLQLRLKLRKLI
jgi:membrane-associated protease RseP (regulator of RpoE activity)